MKDHTTVQAITKAVEVAQQSSDAQHAPAITSHDLETVSQQLAAMPAKVRQATLISLQHTHGNAFVQKVIALSGGAKRSEVSTTSLPEFTRPAKGPIATAGKGDAHAYAANDVMQGANADCYLLSALAATAQHTPKVLADGIKNNHDGTYTVQLYARKGDAKNSKLEPHQYRVTGSFPTKHAGFNAGSQPFLAPHAIGGDRDEHGNAELWIKLYEAAYAQSKQGEGRHSNYEHIDFGHASYAFEAITGKNYRESVSHVGDVRRGAQVADLKSTIIANVAHHEPMTASSFEDTAKTDDGKLHGLHGSHAYSIIYADAHHVVLRDPWGGPKALKEVTWAQFYQCFHRISTPGKRDL
jgi:hypothetical protein